MSATHHARSAPRKQAPRTPGLLFNLATIIFGLAMAAAPARADEKPRYNRDIRPILAENCFACHGPDSAARKADLRLDRRQDATRELPTGVVPIVPGDPDTSELVFRVEESDPSVTMPPPELHKSLNESQKDLLKRWIAAGAEYEPHWSFIPPAQPPLPSVSTESWVRNPIDRFILNRLDAAGFSPAPEADLPTLARRAALDVTGLPPAPALLQSFLQDQAPGAYERYIDRLLDSPAWGEARARSWLDAARYADTHGFHFDNFREMWSYRDWVIDAFNRNQPFDQFTLEQLAGDLLPEPTLDQKIASGFNRCNMTTNEGGTIPEEYLVLYNRDRTETVSQVWLGLTTGCAVCHDHKFDPLSQREFYSLAAFFNNSTQDAMDKNIKDTPPTLFVPANQDLERWNPLQQELAEARQAAESRKASGRGDFDAWLAAMTPDTITSQLEPSPAPRFRARIGPRGTASASLAPLPTLEIADAGDFDKNQPFTIAAWVRPAKADLTGPLAARMDLAADYRGWDFWLDAGRAGTHIISKWPTDALKVVAETALAPNVWTHVVVRYDGSSSASGVSVYYNGEQQKTRPLTDQLKTTIRTPVPFKVAQRGNSERLANVAMNDLRLYDTAFDLPAISSLLGASRSLELAALPAADRPADELDALYAWWLGQLDPLAREVQNRLATLTKEEADLRARGTFAHVMQERSDPAMAFILSRGEYDKRLDQVAANTPEILPPFPDSLPRNRLGFAKWLLDPAHPLTARVTVNRHWQEVFGTGLVRSAGDFGVSGELPSHPELLDWLALDFRDSGWDVKHLFRQMLTSATYRQSAALTPEKLEKDPDNRLLSRGPRFRMEAEMVRDYALAASGLLSEKLGGPSVRPYQPQGVWEAVAMPESNTKNYQPDEGESLYRRSLYTFWKRAAPPALLDVFNAPSRETCTVRRERTNTPLQALATLNDVTFVEAARHLAQRALLKAEPSTTQDRLDFLAESLLSRPFRPEELSVVDQSLVQLLNYYKAHPDDAAQLIAVGHSQPPANLDPSTLASWTMLANQLMNLDEVLCK